LHGLDFEKWLRRLRIIFHRLGKSLTRWIGFRIQEMEAMKTDMMEILPKDLIGKCIQLVHHAHKKMGVGALPMKISFSNPNNMIALAAMDHTASVLKAAAYYAKMRMVCRSAVVIMPVLAWIYNLWFLSGIVIIVVIERVLAKKEQSGWMFLSSVLLCLEMLIHDFAGWGKACPDARKKASEIYGNKSMWLDYYLPKRGQVDPVKIKEFGPK
jgi:hypothetical protein